MRCTRPRTVGFRSDGKTISWSPKNYSKEFATFQLPCGKCIECRLEYARNWAIRCVHESKMHPQNSFITLTYSDEKLTSPKLQYRDFQLFAMRLRSKIRADLRKKIGKINWSQMDLSEKKAIYDANQIGIFVTGEYGDKTKRPHWHAIIFNWQPPDPVPKYRSHRGDQVWSSESLTKLWGHGIAEFGSVTFHSAGYCARYAAKKLSHGSDNDHDFHPISKKSTRHAIGKKFLEKYYEDVFNHGYIILPDGTQTTIPRYYEKWLQKHHPERWLTYVTQTKKDKIAKASEKSQREQYQEFLVNNARLNRRQGLQRTKNDARSKITQSRFKQLQSYNKL